MAKKRYVCKCGRNAEVTDNNTGELKCWEAYMDDKTAWQARYRGDNKIPRHIKEIDNENYL